MQPLEAYTLKAFLAALLQLDSPLPDNLQAQVNQIRIPADVGKLHALAVSYSPLDSFYKAARETLWSVAKERGKGFIPEHEPERFNTETENIVKQSSFKEMVVELDEKIDDEKLAEIATEIFAAHSSVQKAAELLKHIQP